MSTSDDLAPAPAVPEAPPSTPATGPSISVVMPVYNGSRFIAAAIGSVVTQSLVPLELIVVDDGSSDRPEDVIEQTVAALRPTFPVRVLRQHNQGQSAARNEGVRASGGEYVAFLDQDDEWRPKHLAQLIYPLLRNEDVGWSYSDFDEIDGDGQVVTHRFIALHGIQHPRRSLAQCLDQDLMVIPSASILRRTALDSVGGFDPDLIGYEDEDLFVRVFRAGWEHAFVPRPTTRFRVHGTSSSGARSFLNSRMIYLDKLVRTVPDDRRLNRYYVRDLVLPRFFQNTLGDYARAVRDHDYDLAREIAVTLNDLAVRQRFSARRAAEMAVVRYPPAARLVAEAIDRMPSRLRRGINPIWGSIIEHGRGSARIGSR